jgi:hypothetical protein
MYMYTINEDVLGGAKATSQKTATTPAKKRSSLSDRTNTISHYKNDNDNHHKSSQSVITFDVYRTDNTKDIT